MRARLDCLRCGCPAPTRPPEGWECPSCGNGFVLLVLTEVSEVSD